MHLREIFDTYQDVNWHCDTDYCHANFLLDNNEYSISVQTEMLQGYKIANVNFHFIHGEQMVHDATGFNRDHFKIIGIVSNAIKKKFDDCDCIYFTTKEASTDNYISRNKLYAHLCQKLSREENMFQVRSTQNGYTVFGLCKTKTLADKFADFI